MWNYQLLIHQAPPGEPNITVLAKAVFSIAPGETAIRSRSPIPFYENDTFIGGNDPLICPPLHEIDLVVWKPMTDVIIHGNAYAPRGKRAYFFDAGVAIGPIVRKVRVFGNRKVDASGIFLKFSDPVSFDEMPLNFSLAYGGTDTLSNPENPRSYPRNPVGKGFVIDTDRVNLHGMVLPNLEDPSNLLTPGNLLIKRYERWKDAPTPRAFGFLPRHAHSRMEKQQSPDSFAANNGAAPWMQFPRLKGDETVALGYMDPDHSNFEFRLPGIELVVKIASGWRIEMHPMQLQGIEIYKNVNQMTLVWGAQVYRSPEDLERPDWKCIVDRN